MVSISLWQQASLITATDQSECDGVQLSRQIQYVQRRESGHIGQRILKMELPGKKKGSEGRYAEGLV